MLRLLAVAALLTAVLQSEARASLMKYIVTKSNQAATSLKFSITITPQDGMELIHVVLPANQPELADLWRVDLMIRKGKGTIADVPLEMKLVDGVRTTDLFLDPDVTIKSEIWVRTGKQAPLAETVYALDVGSFR